MRLTKEQEKVVEENHNLIYWYGNMRNLDMEEWYDLLAIELCYAVLKCDYSKSNLSTYYKMRCDTLVRKERRNKLMQKRANNGVYPLDECIFVGESHNLEKDVELKSLFDGENGNVIRLKADGYTQSEIAEMLGISQSAISKILAKVREEYYDG